MWESLQSALDNGEWMESAAAVWCVAGVAFVVAVLALGLIKRVLSHRLKKLAGRTELDAFKVAAAIIERTKIVFYLAVGLHLAATIIAPDERVAELVGGAVVIGIFFQLGLWFSEGVAQAVERYDERLDGDPSQANALSAVRILGRLAVWAIVVLLVLDNLGFDITTLVAGLGVGGVAVALAVQNILGDLFASLSIIVDKPFVIGDFIIVGEQMGTVEMIGLKTTRIRSLSGEQIVFSNNDLLQSRVRNFKRMAERRVVFEFGIVHQTPLSQIEAIPDMVRETIQQLDEVRFDRAHFKQFGESALVFEVVYYVLSADFNVYMDIQQEINLELLDYFRREGISLAYPTRTIHVADKSEEHTPLNAPATASV